ncbi:RagB/SusD family nutrient uptake outer membrane protein [Ginsengibacter hankyongi]|uniref:RagB/SusD family nutrient uptake outer membrane protein n=1 Tax=Ginsengibacter hankyongi TaxID=2607284 RepID=A0A5J5IFI6_9BACT|nr:RagB/SusD family nutrient uptake outer membrane protein [Ginsengibacter hankyongi]KAA9038045.1 RagB/SusD family nutrient uptake outer membrane protein [Ginsengibacter hankyongi]
MKIKSFYHLLIVTAGLIAGVQLSSCKKYLDLQPVSSFGPETVFGTVANAQKAVLGAYQEMTGDQGYGIRVSMYFPYDNDEMMGAGGHGDNDRRDIGRYNLTAGNAQLAKPFNQMYQGIERANQCIKYIPQMDLYNNGAASDKAELRRLYGEALTLRAQYYFELVRNWGDVPAQWKPSADQPDLFLAKTDRDSIYDHILNDLKTAEDLVPWPSGLAALGDPKDERITKGAVKGLRARLALFRGGYSLRRDNKMERGSNYLDYYKIADDECLSIIQSGEYALDPSYRDLWQNNLDAHKIDPFGEIMFQVAMAGGTSATDSKLGKYNGPNGSLVILPTYFYQFDSVDTRRDVTIAPFKINSDNSLSAAAITGLYDGKFRRNWITNPDIDISNQAQNFSLNWPLLRYSDVLLMYAEAENEINNGPTPGAIDALQQIRKRAFAGNESAIGTPPSNKDGFFKAIAQERALEFGSEGIRKYDLIRWNLLGQKLAETKQALANMAAMVPPYDTLPTAMYFIKTTDPKNYIDWVTSFYHPAPASDPAGATKVTWISSSVNKGNFSYYTEGFKSNHSELFPIPQQSIDANPNLTQDYGY